MTEKRMQEANIMGAAPLRTALDLTLTKDELEYVAAFLTEDAERDDDSVRLLLGDGHSGYGLYAAHPEYQEEGAILVKNLPSPAEPEAEEVLRSLACWLGVGGYNAPTVDAKVFEAKIRDGVTVYSQAHGLTTRRLAEAVLGMDLITPQGVRAKELARQVLGIASLAKDPE